MSVINASNVSAINLKPSFNQASEATEDKTNSFMSYLSKALNEVSGLQEAAAESGAQLAIGNNEYLHNTTIAYEKAMLGLQLTIEIRNKLVSAYQEIMRMQV